MKTIKQTIICYGDSNTYGFNPETLGRYKKKQRWTGILSDLLGNNFNVIEEGCNNRTGFYNNKEGYILSGALYIKECLKTNPTADIFIFALGTNDLQKFYNFNEQIIKNGLENYLKTIKDKNPNTKIIIISPIQLKKDIINGSFRFLFSENSIINSSKIRRIYKDFAAENNIELFVLDNIVSPSKTDGLHYSEKAHEIIAKNLSELILDNHTF